MARVKQPTPEEIKLAIKMLRWCSELKHQKDETAPSLIKVADWLQAGAK